MNAPNVNEMRNIIIYTNEDENIIERLKQLSDWKLKPLEIEGSFEYCLEKDGVKIALSIDAKNVAITANILPYDWEHDQESANNYLMELSESLDTAGIHNSITASDKDLGK